VEAARPAVAGTHHGWWVDEGELRCLALLYEVMIHCAQDGTPSADETGLDSLIIDGNHQPPALADDLADLSVLEALFRSVGAGAACTLCATAVSFQPLAPTVPCRQILSRTVTSRALMREQSAPNTVTAATEGAQDQGGTLEPMMTTMMANTYTRPDAVPTDCCQQTQRIQSFRAVNGEMRYRICYTFRNFSTEAKVRVHSLSYALRAADVPPPASQLSNGHGATDGAAGGVAPGSSALVRFGAQHGTLWPAASAAGDASSSAAFLTYSILIVAPPPQRTSSGLGGCNPAITGCAAASASSSSSSSSSSSPPPRVPARRWPFPSHRRIAWRYEVMPRSA
jgi:hypothetical protein